VNTVILLRVAAIVAAIQGVAHGTLILTAKPRHGPAESERDAKRILARVMTVVGRELGNTPTVARESYVSPVVVETYLAGRTLADFRGGRSRGPARMSVDERALVRLLRAASRGSRA